MREPNYDKNPYVKINGCNDQVFSSYDTIVSELKSKISENNSKKTVLAIECYHGVNDKELLGEIEKRLTPVLTVNSKNANLPNGNILNMIKHNLSDDRVRGIMSHFSIDEFFDKGKISKISKFIDNIDNGVVLIYGVGATLIHDADIIVYADMARWEVELRYRRGEIANWCADNYLEDWLLMYKRGFFVEWPTLDRYKREIINDVDYYLDTNKANVPKMITKDAFFRGLEQASKQPFRVVPYFDTAPWGGQWMKEVCDLDKNAKNFGWCFDCVPEENSLQLEYNGHVVEMPSMNLVYLKPKDLLGDNVYSRFGENFPIRFDFLDTMQGGHLSLQVHPTTNYIQEKFGIHYTQDESYYMLDAGKDACVYLGTKTGIKKDEMIADLEAAQAGEKSFDDEKFINKIPTKKHDHFLIPGGTIHCSGAESMVLEISATPYIFTFKLWDWDRLGLDGKPRPIHIDHGKNVINWDLNTEEIMNNHVNCIEKVGYGDGWEEEKTGLHKMEFIETRRHWFNKKVIHNTNGTVNVLNLIEGDEAIVESPLNVFEPYVVHYAETFIIPASVGEYTIKPYGSSKGKQCGTIKAYVR